MVKGVFTDICRICLLWWTVADAAALSTQLTPADWLRADAATVRLSPSVYSNLPASIRTEMERRGCTVPQPYDSERRRNVIRGRFKHAERKDWAALCSRGGRSVVLVFHGKNFSQVDELAEAADSEYLQTVMEDRIGFSRALAVATPDILKRPREDDGPKPPIIDHDGIDDAFEGKASIVWYWLEGKWVALPGSD